MLKLETNKLSTTTTLLIFVVASITLTIFVTLSGNQYAGAQASQQPTVDLNNAAAEFCGAGNVGGTDSACRFGFRAGYSGDPVASACAKGNHNPEYNAAQVEACKKGHPAGKTFKTTGSVPAGGAGGPATASTPPFFGANDSTNTACGAGPNAYKPKFNIGCRGQGNPIFDALFAIIRFLTYGVGIAVTIAIIVSGIQYTTSEGSPEKTMAAKNHIQNALIALMIYLFSFAILNFLIPGGLLT